MYVKVSISGMEMSQNLFLSSKFAEKIHFFEKMAKNHFFGHFFFKQPIQNAIFG